MSTLLETAASDILKHISDALVLLDLDGRVVFHNDAFAAMVGQSGEDLRGASWSQLAGLPAGDHVHPAAASDARPALLTIDIPAANGASRLYCVKREPFTDQAGHVTGVFQSFRPLDCGRAAALDLRVATRASGPDDAAAEPADAEQRELRRALEANRWNASRTARALGISRTTLWRRMRRAGLLPRVQPT